jgi:hypothetical protein
MNKCSYLSPRECHEKCLNTLLRTYYIIHTDRHVLYVYWEYIIKSAAIFHAPI